MIALALSLVTGNVATDAPHASPHSTIEEVMLSPLYRQAFVCSQHPQGQLKYKGDALGQDCMIIGGIDERNEASGGYPRLFRNDGTHNEDWFGWGAELLAPFDGTVKKVSINPVVNAPGTLGKPPASIIVFEDREGTDVLYAHVQNVKVKAGDHVAAGQVVARVGNNGMARAPHTHIGAWHGETPLQIRWDLRAMGKLVSG